MLDTRILFAAYFLLLSQTLIAAENLCDTCSCSAHDKASKMVVIHCIKKNLTSIPEKSLWPVNPYGLDVSYNNITTLKALEENDNVKLLDLHRNNLELIDQNVLTGYPNLEYLDISENVLKTLSKDIFNGLENLITLNMSYNNIKTLPNGLFEPFVKLRELKLSGNPIRYLDKNSFLVLLNVRKLDISNIYAHSLEDGVFHSMENLRILDLSRNDFEEFPTSALRSAVNLKELYFSENMLAELNEDSFKDLTQLELLELNEMLNLRKIKKLAFSPLSSLRVLKMASNSRLSHIDPSAFDGIYNHADKSTLKLKVVNLRNNDLSTLDNNMLPWCDIQTLDLQGNKWYCDCYMNWIIKCSIPGELSVDLRCVGPKQNAGKSIKSLHEEDFVCSHEEAPDRYSQAIIRTVAAITGLVVLLILIMAIVLFVKRRRIRAWWTFRKRGPGEIYYVKANTNPTDVIDL